MTKHSPTVRPSESEAPKRCAWCSRALAERPSSAVGRKPKYCRRSCRQRAFEARRRADELGLGDDELVVTKNELDDANDRLFEIRALLRDANLDVRDGVGAHVVLTRLVDAIDSVVGTN